MTKFLQRLVLTAALLLTVNSHAREIQILVDDISYRLNTEDYSASILEYPRYCAGDVVIPASMTYKETTYTVTSIGNAAFYGRDEMTSVIIPSSVTSIGANAFEGCTGLTSITIPSSVTSIGEGAFAWCYLSEINVSPDNIAYSSEDGILYNKEKTTLLAFPSDRNGDFTIPSSVTSVGAVAFLGCSLTSIAVPAGVKSIGEGTFKGSYALTAINVSYDNIAYSSEDGVLYDKNKTILYACPGGRNGSFTIPSSVTNIGKKAFAGCYYLSSVSIPRSVTTIEDGAFNGCRDLIAVYSSNPVPPTTNGSCFIGISWLATLYVPANSVEAYRNAAEWNGFQYIKEFDPTGINCIEADRSKKNTYYDLNGRKLNSPLKGLNIINGRKVMVHRSELSKVTKRSRP